MGKYEQLAKDIIKNIGGAQNIDSVTHCITRLRFKLKDESIANDDVLKAMDGVVTVMHSAGQYQVVIGNHVPNVYADVCEVAGISDNSPLESEHKKNKNIFDSLIDVISGIFQPILGVMTAAGMLKGLNALFLAFGWYSDQSGAAVIMNTIGDAMFMYLPVMLGYTSAKKFGLKPFVGLVIGAALCYPAIQLSTLSAGGDPLYTLFTGTLFESPVYLDLFGIPMIAMDYTSTVIPVILICYFASKAQKLFEHLIPEMLKFFFVPMLTLFVSLVLGFLIIGPIATYASTIIAEGVMQVRDFSPMLAGALVGGFWQILVIFGLHWGFIPIYINNIATMGFDNVMMPFFGATFAQTAVVVAMLIKTKDKKLKSLCIPAAISGFFGVTEPAIYGITLPRKKPFFISCIAAAVAGAYLGFANLKEYIMGGLGIFEFPAMINPADNSMESVIVGAIGVVIAVVIGFVLTMIFFKDDPKSSIVIEDPKEKKAIMTKETIVSPMQGTLKALSEIKDDAFAKGVLGKGIAIEPVNGTVYSPVDGTVMTLFPTKHAIGLISDNGCEVLIHIGLDTVQLDGKYFESHVKQGDHVEKGQLLVSFDKEKIEAQGYCVDTPIIITNTKDYLDVVETSSKEVKEKDDLITVLM